MKNKVLIYILALSVIFSSGCSNSNIIDKEDENVIIEKVKDESKSEKIDDTIDQVDANDAATKESSNVDKLKEAKSPKYSGVKFDIDLDSYTSILPLTEDWEFYHNAEKTLMKELLTIDGQMYDDSVLFFECDGQYIAIASDKDNYAATFIAIIDQMDDDFRVEFVDRYRYSFNSAKEEVLIKENEIILMTQFPFSAYSLFGKFIHEDNTITYDSLVDYDSSVAYYSEFMELLNEGAMDKAMKLEDYSSYPFSYETLYFKSANLAIKKSLEFAKVSIKKSDDKRAKELLEWGLGIYLEKHYNYTFDKDMIVFDSVYIKDDKDFGFDFLLSNDFMFDYLDLYLEIYNKCEDQEKTDLLIEKIDEFKLKLLPKSGK